MRLPNNVCTGVVLLSAVAALGCNSERPTTAVVAGETRVVKTPSSAMERPNVVPLASVIESASTESRVSSESNGDSAVNPPIAPKPPAASLDELFLFVPLKIPPDQRPANPDGLEDLWLTSSDGTKLHAWWCEHPQPVAHVLYLHGNSGNLWTVAGFLKWLHDVAGCAVLCVDYRGYGLSEGSPTVEGVLKDARTARDELRRRIGDENRREVLIGRSLGGALAVDVAADEQPRGLVLESTFASFKEIARLHAGGFAKLVPEGKLDSRRRLALYPGPLLQMHGDADRLIPFEQGVSLHECATGPKQFMCITGGGHNFVRPREYLTELERFLRELP